MRTFCEIASKTLIPSLRALIALILVEKYKMTQVDVAKKLGITQPAISYYLHSKRGKEVIDFLKNNRKVLSLVEEVVDEIYSVKEPKDVHMSLCKLCTALRSDREVMKYIEEKIFKKTTRGRGMRTNILDPG